MNHVHSAYSRGVVIRMILYLHGLLHLNYSNDKKVIRLLSEEYTLKYLTNIPQTCLVTKEGSEELSQSKQA